MAAGGAYHPFSRNISGLQMSGANDVHDTFALHIT